MQEFPSHASDAAITKLFQTKQVIISIFLTLECSSTSSNLYETSKVLDIIIVFRFLGMIPSSDKAFTRDVQH